MDVRLVGPGGVTRHPVADLPDLLTRDDGLVWVDIPSCDEAIEPVSLSKVWM